MNTTAEKFWYGWLRVATIIVIFFGIALAFSSIFSNNGLAFLDRQISGTFKLNPQFMVELAEIKGWMIGIIGATTTGWGITLLYLITVPLKRKEKWAWNAIMISIIIWFSLDTYVSNYYGAKFNVILNIAFAMQFFAPLLFIRNTMFNKQQNEVE